tara:strand:- start:61 stop:495 length:435 start_codon:yes stop_codon:yes gene_type:complete
MINKKRECGSCSTCCEGWVHGEAHGYPFYPGRPCHFMKKTSKGGCSIYKNRPQDPCKLFKCGWLENPKLFPEWLKPELSKLIIVSEIKEGHQYYIFKNCGEELSAKFLDWIVVFSLTNKKNVIYYLEGRLRKLGSPQFCSLDIR